MNATTSNEIAVLKPPRLPYHDAIGERFGVDRAGWKALTEAIFPNARTADSIIMALSYCRARKLDPFKRPVHIVPMWSSASRSYVETVWPGISELRTTAFRTGQYAGKGETEFGPMTEKTFKGTLKEETRTVTVRFPEWARVSVTRMLNHERCTFVSPKVFWLESYAKWGNTDVPNDMWSKRPSGQLEKCVEAAGLRCAFPEEIGNDYAAEEMEGQRLVIEGTKELPRADDGPPPPPSPRITHQPQLPTAREPERELVAGETVDPSTGEVLWGDAGPDNARPATQDDGIPPFLDRKQNGKPVSNMADEKAWLNDLGGAFSTCEDMVSFGTKQRDVMAPMKSKVSGEAWTAAQHLAEDTFRRIGNG